MKGKILSAILGIPVLAAGLIGGAGGASAAVLTGPGEISFNGSVILTGIEEDGKSGVNFDFIPPPGPPDGEIDQAFTSGIGGFSGFNPSSPGRILDVDIFQDTTTNPAQPIANFITIDGGADPDTTYTLTDIGLPDFRPRTDPDTGTTDLFVTVQTRGEWLSGNGETFDGTGSFTATFVDTTREQFDADIANTGVPLDPKAFAADLEAVHNRIPEPTSALAVLLAMSLSAFSLKRKKQEA